MKIAFVESDKSGVIATAIALISGWIFFAHASLVLHYIHLISLPIIMVCGVPIYIIGLSWHFGKLQVAKSPFVILAFFLLLLASLAIPLPYPFWSRDYGYIFTLPFFLSATVLSSVTIFLATAAREHWINKGLLLVVVFLLCCISVGLSFTTTGALCIESGLGLYDANCMRDEFFLDDNPRFVLLSQLHAFGIKLNKKMVCQIIGSPSMCLKYDLPKGSSPSSDVHHYDFWLYSWKYYWPDCSVFFDSHGNVSSVYFGRG